VPQGAILLPILFNLFINDLSFGKDCFLFKYADDTTLLLPHSSKSTHVKKSNFITSKICYMQSWCKQNGLLQNDSKTQIMTVNKSRHPYHFNSESERIKILGVFFNPYFKWNEQIDYLVKKIRAKCLSHQEIKAYSMPKRPTTCLQQSYFIDIVLLQFSLC